MKRYLRYLIAIIVVISLGNTNYLKAESVDNVKAGEDIITLNTDGVDDTFKLVNTKEYLNTGIAWTYEDTYMGNLVISNYEGIYEGWVYSVFGMYELGFNSLGEITDITRYNNEHNVMPFGGAYQNKYTQEELNIIADKAIINKNIIKTEYQEDEGTPITFLPMYTQKFLDIHDWQIENLYAHIICEVAITQQLLTNTGFSNEIILLDPNKINYDDNNTEYNEFVTQLFNKSSEVDEILNLIETKQSDYNYVYMEPQNLSAQAITVAIHSWDSSNNLGVEKSTSLNPYYMGHEFSHSLGLGHNKGDANFSDYRATAGFVYADMVNQGGNTVGDIMSNGNSKLLYYSSSSLLIPTANNYSKPNSLGNYYESDSLNYLHKSILGYKNRFEEVAEYGETYKTFPQIDLSKVNFESMIRYYPTSATDNGYSDLQWNSDVTINVDQELTTYKPGGTGNKYDTLVFDVTNSAGNTKKFYRDIQNIDGSYDAEYSPITAYTTSDIYLDNDKYIQDFNIDVNPNNISNVITQMQLSQHIFNEVNVSCTSQLGELDMSQLNELYPGENLTCKYTVDSKDYYGHSITMNLKTEYRHQKSYTQSLILG